MNGHTYRTLQIPSTLPTLDELLGLDGLTPQNVGAHLDRVMNNRKLEHEVHSVHTEVEGTALFDSFSKWIRSRYETGTAFVTLSEIAAKEKSHAASVPHCEVKLQTIPGRAGPVACQIV